MQTRFGNGSISVRARQILGVVIFLCAAQQTAVSASAISSVYLSLVAPYVPDVILTDPVSVGGRNEGIGGTATGSAGFPSGMSLSLTSTPLTGSSARAYLDDYLIFHIPGGGSTQVNVSISGQWTGTYNWAVNADFQVGFRLGLGSTLYGGNGYANLNYNDGIPASLAFTASDTGGTVEGTYLFSTPWTVYDGQLVGFYSDIRAQASNGASAFINDPLIITLPAGVTFTSDSGSTYASVPEPSTLLFLLGGGIVALAGRPKRAQHSYDLGL